eukprot:jgi/Chrzof1/5966/Cz16g22010.t1
MTLCCLYAGENVPGKYISQTYWASQDAFQQWTQSQQFRSSHGDKAGPNGDKSSSKRPNVMTMLEGPPSPEFFTSVTMTE